MEADKIEKIIKSIEKGVSLIFHFGVSIVNIGVTVLLIFGAAASIMLLYNLFPDMYLLLSGPMQSIFLLILFILKIVGVLLIISICFLLIFYVVSFFEDQQRKINKKKEVDRKKFMDQVVRRLKTEKNK